MTDSDYRAVSPDKSIITDTILKLTPQWVQTFVKNRILDSYRAYRSGIKFRREDGVYRADSGDTIWYIPQKSALEVKSCLSFMDRTERFLSYLGAGDIVIEVGAATGEYTVAASKILGTEGKLYAIEAEPRNFICLKKNTDYHGVGNIAPYQRVFSNRGGKTITFSLSPYSTTSHGIDTSHSHSRFGRTFRKGVYEQVELETETLDEFSKSKGITEVDLLKVTVNGHEASVLEGADEILSNTNYVLMQISYPEAIDYLQKEHGFDMIEEIESEIDKRPDGPTLLESPRKN